MKNLNLMAAALLASTTLAFTPAVQAKLLPTTDKGFVKHVKIANDFEIESSKLALTHSQNPAVKEFAQHMIDDHSKAGEAYKDAVAQAKLTAEVPAKLDRMHQHELNELKEESGKKFDKEYVEAQAKAHKKAVDLFADYSKNGSNAPLKTFASQTLPTLQKHDEEVKQLKASIK